MLSQVRSKIASKILSAFSFGPFRFYTLKQIVCNTLLLFLSTPKLLEVDKARS